MTGRRTAQRTAQRKPVSTPRRRSGVDTERREKTSSRERLRLAQFVICAIIFVSVVSIKLLLPGKLGTIRNSVADAMSRNMDVTEVFSAVGKAFSGKENFKKGAHDFYQAVFHPEGNAVETAAKVSTGISSKSSSGATKQTAQKTTPTPAQQEKEKKPAATQTAEQNTVQTKEASKLACVLYSASNCPKNVSMEQEVLGFHYCTPVKGVLSSPFGYREHPVDGEERFHYGVDLAADTGTAIKCFADGTVTVAGESTSYGKYLMVAHRGGYTTLYAHCSKILVSSDKKVHEGEKIAEVGETGMATGPHLHFELHHGNTYLNPIYYVTAERV